MTVLVEGIAAAYEAEVTIDLEEGYPVTKNHIKQTEFAANIARDVVGDARMNDGKPPVMGGEDFSYMLLERPGAFIFMGNGDSQGLHHEEYDFNDEAIPVGSSYWAKIAETAMPTS